MMMMPDMEDLIPEEDDSDSLVNDYISSFAIWTWETVEMVVLIKAAVLANPTQKWSIYITAGATSILTSSVITGVGVALAEVGTPISKSWVELIEGLTKLFASYVLAKVAVRYAQFAFAGKPFTNKIGLSRTDKLLLLVPVIMNIFRETGEGALSSIGLLVQKSYGVIAFNLIPLAVLSGQALFSRFQWKNRPKWNTHYIPEFLLTGLFALLGTGLWATGWHDLEEVAGETPEIYNFGTNVTVAGDYEILSQKNLPFAFLGPFGYRPNPTILTSVMGSTYFVGITSALLLSVWLAKRVLSAATLPTP